MTTCWDDTVIKVELDNGCNVNPVPRGCQTCPLPACKYDDIVGYQRWKHQQADALVFRKTQELAVVMGKAQQVLRVAREMGISERTVYRQVARHLMDAK